MTAYVLHRLAWAVVILGTVAIITFTLTFVVPADPVRAMVGLRASAEDVERIRAAMRLDEPMLSQLGAYLAALFQGDFGTSFHHRREVLDLIIERFPATLQLATAGILLSLALGIPIGVASARCRGSRWDLLLTVITAAFVSIPHFWLGYVLILLLAFAPLMTWGIDVFAIGGYEPWSLRHLALPALALGLTGAAYYSRLIRTAMLDELRSDYVRTATAKGLAKRRIVWRHAFRNALPSVVAQLGLDVGLFLGGVVVIEKVFAWPGIGKLAVDAIDNADTPLILGTVLFATILVVIANLLADLGVALLDPRVRA